MTHLEDTTTHGIISVKPTKYAYCVSTIVTGPYIKMRSASYGITSITCAHNKRIFPAICMSNNPLWSFCEMNDIYIADNISDINDKHMQIHQIRRYTKIDKQKISDVTLYPLRYQCMLDTSTGVSVIISDIGTQDIPAHHTLSVRYISNSESDVDPTTSILCCMEKIMSIGYLRNHSIVADITKNSRRWYNNVHSIPRRSAPCCIYIDKSMIQECAEGMFIKSEGRYTHWYIHRNTCYALNSLKGTLQHIYTGYISTFEVSTMVVSGYVSSETQIMQVCTCIDVRTWMTVSVSEINAIIKSNECFEHPRTGDASDWRLFVPSRQNSIVQFRSVKENHQYHLSSPNVLDCLIASSIYRFVSDTDQDMVFIVGKPRAEYQYLIRETRVCWIHDIEWDSDFADTYNTYSDVTHAINTCRKHQRNICTTRNWLDHLKNLHSLFLLVLDDDIDTYYSGISEYEYVSLDKFIICTSSVNHPIIESTRTKSTAINIQNSIVDIINTNLKVYSSATCNTVLTSESMMPYISTRLFKHYYHC